MEINDPLAIRVANDLFYHDHPELVDRPLTNGMEDAALRREWMDHYEAIARPPSPPEPGEEPEAASEALSEEPAYPVKACAEICEDDSGTMCPCCDRVTITFYVQKGASPAEIALNYASGERNLNTGHAFIAIGLGPLKDRKAYGFYPDTSWTGGTGRINTNDGFYIPGEDEPIIIGATENAHIYTDTEPFTACPSQVAKMEAAIKKDIDAIKANSDDAPKYSLAGLQCTTWAAKHLETLGFSPPKSATPFGAANELDEEKKPVE